MKATAGGRKLSNKSTKIFLAKKGTTITFHGITKTKDGILCGLEMAVPLDQGTRAKERNLHGCRP